MAYPSPLLRTNFYVNKRKVSNKYNYTKFFLKKIQFQIQRLSVLVYAFVAIAEKFPFLLTSSLVKPPLPLMSENVSISLTPPPPPRVLTSYVNGPRVKRMKTRRAGNIKLQNEWFCLYYKKTLIYCVLDHTSWMQFQVFTMNCNIL